METSGLRVVTAVVAGALALTGCSGDSDGAGPFGADEPEAVSPTTAAPPTLEGSDAILIDRFTVTDVVTADGSFRSIAGGEAWFELSADGTFVGFDGCGSLTGTFSISGAYVDPAGASPSTAGQQFAARVVERSATCDGDVEARAVDVVAALDDANRWVSLDPTTFILRDFEGGNLLIATP